MPPTIFYIISKLIPMARERECIWLDQLKIKIKLKLQCQVLQHPYMNMKNDFEKLNWKQTETLQPIMKHVQKKSIIHIKSQTCKSRFIGTGLFRSQIISETAPSWLEVREYGRAFRKFLVRLDHSSIKTAFNSGFLYLSSNPSFSICVPRPSSIWNKRPNWQ